MVRNHTNKHKIYSNLIPIHTTTSCNIISLRTWHYICIFNTLQQRNFNTKYSLSSDHFAIITTLANTTFKHHQQKHSYTTYKKANWIKFTEKLLSKSSKSRVSKRLKLQHTVSREICIRHFIEIENWTFPNSRNLQVNSCRKSTRADFDHNVLIIWTGVN